MQSQIISPTSTTIVGLFQSFLQLLPPLLIFAFLAIIVYGGFVRMTAAGDPEKEKQSMQILTAGVIGFLIIALSPLIVNLVSSFLGLSNLFAAP